MVESKQERREIGDIILELVGNRWRLIIIQNLMDGTKRFGELKKQVGDITQKVLASNLKALEEQGLLIREVYAQIPPRVEYTLTSVGESLKPLIESAIEWGMEYRAKLLSD
ncbi:MAG: helix-turn-helix transcriptional regulator [Lactobacillus sp.]|jgi:DNA-binding HxlR family transcriptional regulator|nr:helix-turn-helix transcriptional regulator [Lactobacillus sp.]